MTENWRPPKCNIRSYVVRKYGRSAACHHNDATTWDECDAKCKMASNCPGCGDPRILVSDPCSGRNALCMNPDCGYDK